MAYDDLKEYAGQTYTGMAIGGEHTWIYPGGLWREQKVAPDKWEFTLSSIKERERSAPPDSGAAPGTQYHWYLLAHQKVRKIDSDAYSTFMEGVKYRIAHRRPHWRRWSCDYPQQPSALEKVVAILESTVAELKDNLEMMPPGRGRLALLVPNERAEDVVP